LKTTLFVKHPYLPVCFRFIALSWLQILLYSETRTWHRRQIFKAQVEISIHIMQNKKGQGMYFVIFVRKISSEGKTIWACKTFLKCPFKMVFLATWIDILKPLPPPSTFCRKERHYEQLATKGGLKGREEQEMKPRWINKNNTTSFGKMQKPLVFEKSILLIKFWKHLANSNKTK
jgi:hypothetical protein